MLERYCLHSVLLNLLSATLSSQTMDSTAIFKAAHNHILFVKLACILV